MARFRFWKTMVSAAVLTVFSLGPTVAEETLDSNAFQRIIKNQMNAFAAGNAKTAYSFATNSLQQKFRSPELFMEMVRQGYQPVYNPKSVTFGQSKITKFGPTQEVHVVGPKGKNWLVLYSFEQQEDGSWRISGCYLTKSDGLAA
ncbi:DUF4864 domain-containing protein [Roseibium album]|uniref:DUF4864 domain-containing protein n=1 Tax=Roseibium album TaxID=311410 RepID=UPI0018C975BC|nr:DUF4864 domain-containing protein [Roseibium album]MBG6156198.1 hypothetical protein [Labrenzia sp. EL_162]MBG6163989.1 hypothetical protein [Labrenzia sp. EL_195]MBG6194731.1 hypothetical protein [Labrenzia sp. EL_159]